ncbi:unnamed protein product [Arabis nemorensis]|uniref:Uncharacterized protein n=1 Tax=Arabis nemorensis TaxID=586526 RepID=A0A565BEI6_9BRAS|nr:unnamed protein product [Arabis nemorensis]
MLATPSSHCSTVSTLSLRPDEAEIRRPSELEMLSSAIFISMLYWFDKDANHRKESCVCTVKLLKHKTICAYAECVSVCFSPRATLRKCARRLPSTRYQGSTSSNERKRSHTHKTTLSNLRSIVKDLDAKVNHMLPTATPTSSTASANANEHARSRSTVRLIHMDCQISRATT